jgi:hypothetical protein
VQCQARSWAERYDYVLRLNAGMMEMPYEERLRRVAGGGFAVLYRVPLK